MNPDHLLQNFQTQYTKFIHDMYKDNTKLSQACHYALEGKGKRIRPLLTLMSHALFSEKNFDHAMSAAIAIEMIHTYSLVHDDMPLMDNDDLRRGRATVHKKYDEATALLVGDALLSDAFFFLSEAHSPAMVRELAQAIGGKGIVYGQSLDIEWTGRSSYTLTDLQTIHKNKTGKLFAACCVLGALAGGANAEDCENMRSVGEDFGLAFQIQDDILDEQAGIGKTSGKDKAAGKLTYLRFMSAQDAKKYVEELKNTVCHRLEPYTPRSVPLQRWITENQK